MLEVRQFAHRIDKKKPEFIKTLQKLKLISREAITYQKMTLKERAIYRQRVGTYIDQYFPEKWKNTIAKCCKFRDPVLLNLFDVHTHLQSEVFVAAFFSKPGRHHYVVADYRDRRKVHSNQKVFECEENYEPVPICKSMSLLSSNFKLSNTFIR